MNREELEAALRKLDRKFQTKWDKVFEDMDPWDDIATMLELHNEHAGNIRLTYGFPEPTGLQHIHQAYLEPDPLPKPGTRPRGRPKQKVSSNGLDPDEWEVL